MKILCAVITAVLCLTGGNYAHAGMVQADSVVKLPDPVVKGGMPLMEVLAARKTTRGFAPKSIDDATLSNMLWAGWGFNRPNAHRTVPTAMNVQNVLVFVSRADGFWLYDAENNALKRMNGGPLTEFLGKQPFVPQAAVTLVYAADLSKKRGAMEDRDMPVVSAMHVGSVYQNVALYCASRGLNNVVRTGFDKEALADELKLPPHIRVMAAHSIGWEK